MERFEQEKEVWYAGLGEAYTRRRHYSDRMGLLNGAGQRLGIYRAASLVFLGAGLFVLYLALGLEKAHPAIVAVFAAASLALLWIAFTHHRYATALKNALATGRDPDAHDPLRRIVFRKAAQWGVEEGLVREEKGRLVFRKP